jgi:hypothetical protein
VEISQNYSLKTRTNKQPIGKIPGFDIISSHPLKYPRSKQGLNVLGVARVSLSRVNYPVVARRQIVSV